MPVISVYYILDRHEQKYIIQEKDKSHQRASFLYYEM